jgi:NADH dehydrogenase FAD-containing subunit
LSYKLLCLTLGQVIFGDYIDSFPEGSTAPDGYKTRNGKHLDADLIVPTRGGRPATAFLANSGLSLNTRGQVAVEGTLQAKGAPRVFVIGDATDLPEQKQVAKLDAHAAVAVPNVLAVLAGTPPPKTYNGATELIVVTNGKVRATRPVWQPKLRLTSCTERWCGLLQRTLGDPAW